nr:MAG TPA: hypothetical protein [Caudoviricetes sp.]
MYNQSDNGRFHYNKSNALQVSDYDGHDVLHVKTAHLYGPRLQNYAYAESASEFQDW